MSLQEKSVNARQGATPRADPTGCWRMHSGRGRGTREKGTGQGCLHATSFLPAAVRSEQLWEPRETDTSRGAATSAVPLSQPLPLLGLDFPDSPGRGRGGGGMHQMISKVPAVWGFCDPRTRSRPVPTARLPQRAGDSRDTAGLLRDACQSPGWSSG